MIASRARKYNRNGKAYSYVINRVVRRDARFMRHVADMPLNDKASALNAQSSANDNKGD